MVFETFTALVAVLALAYAGITKFVQSRLIDRKEMEAIQKESKRLSDEFEKAKKADDKKAMDRLTKEQMEFLPKMNKAMMGQFKPMIIILLVFFGFTWALDQLDPSLKDDISFNLTDDGAGCDKLAGDGIFSGCYTLDSEDYGKWMFKAKAFKGQGESGHNSTLFQYNSEQSDGYAESPQGEPIELSTDKPYYSKGDEAALFAKTSADRVEAHLDAGTAFAVELPLTIPIINVKTIHQHYWWFIFISVIANLSMTAGAGLMKKVRG
jgi:hypothetical protein